MPSTTKALCLIAAATIIGCGGSSSPDQPAAPTGPTTPTTPTVPAVRNTPGTTNQVLTVGGVSRSFIRYVGSSAGSNTAVPVVFMLHGTSQQGLDFYPDSKWREKADEVGLIVVFADALSYCYAEDENGDGDFVDPGERRVSTKWTHGPLGNPAQMPFCTAAEIAQLSAQQRAIIDHPFQDDVLYVDAVIAFLKANNVIDEKRIYATGFSNGASFVARLAVERSQTFAALAAHSGPLQVPAVPGRTLSFMATLGGKDDGIAAATGLAQLPVSPSLLTDVPAVKAKAVTPMLTQLRLADVNTYEVATVSGKRIAKYTFRTSLAGASNEFVFSVIEDNFHTYPNGTNHPVVMANLLWSFFEAKRLP